MMNEFVGEKLGELLAFNRVGVDTYEKGRAAFVEALGEEKVLDIEERDRMHGEAVMRMATDGGVIDATLAKAKETEAELKMMRDSYITDHWNNATELMEWGGFLKGGAIVHWSLMRGIAEGMNNEDLLTLSEEGVNWHYEMLELSEGHLGKDGQDKVSE